MSDLLNILNSDLGKKMISGISKESGASSANTSRLLSMAMPLLMDAMKSNSSSSQGAQGLFNALANKHDGSILDNLDGFFKGGVDPAMMKDGQGILKNVLGSKQPGLENALSKKTGMDKAQIMKMVAMAAPLVMGYLGRQKRKQGVQNANQMGDMLGGLLGGLGGSKGNAAAGSLINGFLDADGDGDIMDDVANMLASGGAKKGGLGGLLGNLFKK